VHKVQLKPRKKLSWTLSKVWSKDLRVCCQVAHRTVSGAPGRAPSETATLGFYQGSLLGMAILPAGSGIHGYPTRRIRVRVRNLTRGSHPYPTRDKIGSGTSFIFHPRVLADIRNYFSFHFSILAHQKPAAQPNVHLYSPITRNPSLTQQSASHRLTVSLSLSRHRQKPSAGRRPASTISRDHQKSSASQPVSNPAIPPIGDEVQQASPITSSAWNLWKERCWRIFDNRCTPHQ
jgi:hypothetical protein